jgi:hypothetical protein
MAWVEWREKRQINVLPDRIEVETTMNGVPSDAAPALGSTLTEILGSDVLEDYSSQYDSEATLIGAGKVYRVDEARSRVTIRFRCFLKES